ncbi:MAG TPA: hypothetical protein VGI65_04620 [Steroidobacteraceae bacterium]|jgi:hypothetical protein
MTRFSTPKVVRAAGLALVFALGCAHGQDLQAVQACTRLAADSARLSCYDTAMGRPGPAASAANPQPAPLTTAAGTTNSPKNLSAQVREVTPLPAGLYRLTLDNGQVWDTTQADSALMFKVNDAVTITRGLLGGHQISLAGHNTSVSVIRKQ